MINYQLGESPIKRARIILSDHCDDYSELVLSPVVYVLAGPFPNHMGHPHWLVVHPEEGAKPKMVQRLRFE